MASAEAERRDARARGEAVENPFTDETDDDARGSIKRPLAVWP